MSARRGVNLGGWLVLERWMTPALFEGTDAPDEYSFMSTSGASRKIAQHRETFIQEADFKWIADHHLEMIRIPVGYWILDGDGPYLEAVSHLDWAMDMAAKYNLDVVICLHGAPGSQNGHDHSGRKGRAAWYDDPSYQSQTIDFLMRLARRYRNNSALWGIELLNEPRTRLFQGKLRVFYRKAYATLEEILPSSCHVIFSDAFMPNLLNGAIRAHKQPVVMDIHWYHFTYWAFRQTPLKWYYQLVLRLHRATLGWVSRRQPVIIGEWSGVIAGEILNKYPEKVHLEMNREHIARQMQIYDDATAWFYWTYKTQEPGVWNYRSLVEDDSTTFE